MLAGAGLAGVGHTPFYMATGALPASCRASATGALAQEDGIRGSLNLLYDYIAKLRKTGTKSDELRCSSPSVGLPFFTLNTCICIPIRRCFRLSWQHGGRPPCPGAGDSVRRLAGYSEMAHDATVSQLAALNLRVVLHSPPRGGHWHRCRQAASWLGLRRAKLIVNTANGRGESSEPAPHM